MRNIQSGDLAERFVEDAAAEGVGATRKQRQKPVVLVGDMEDAEIGTIVGTDGTGFGS